MSSAAVIEDLKNTSEISAKDLANPAYLCMLGAKILAKSLSELLLSYDSKRRASFFKIRGSRIKLIRKLISMAAVYATSDSFRNPRDIDKLLQMRLIAAEADYLEELLHSLERFRK